MEESWKTINGFEDYEVSTDGRVRSHKGNNPAILKPRVTHDGYIWYSLCKNGKGYTKRANRLVAEAFIPNPDKKNTVNHIDGDKQNNNVSNLEWATRSEQMSHAYKLGLKKPVRGWLQGKHRLSRQAVNEIRRIYKAHSKEFGMRALARKYGVSESCIDRCVRGQSYINVGE